MLWAKNWYDTGVGGLVPRDESYVIVNYTVRTLGLKAGAFEGLPAFQLSTLETFKFFLPSEQRAFGKLKTRRLRCPTAADKVCATDNCASPKTLHVATSLSKATLTSTV